MYFNQKSILAADYLRLSREDGDLSLIHILQSINDKADRANLFRIYIESFEWRNKIYLSISELLKLCNEYSIEPAILWNAFINNSVKKDHLLNADTLYDVLKRYPPVSYTHLPSP